MIKRSITNTLFILLLTQFVFSAEMRISDDGQKQQQKIVEGQFVVKFKNSENTRTVNNKALSDVLIKYNISERRNAFEKAANNHLKEKLNLHNVFVMKTSSDVMQIVNELNKNPDVEYAEPVYINKFDDVTPNDALYAQLVHLPQIAAPQAWEIQYGSSDVIIGILDSGVDWLHEDLKDVIFTNEAEIDSNGIDDDENGYIDDVRGWDFVTGVSGTGDTDAHPDEDSEEPDNNPMDFGGHGTHVSGIAAGHTNNGIGIASVSSGASILPLRCGWESNSGTGYVSSLFAADAYVYAADMGATVVNQSSGSSGQLIVDAAYYAFLNGTLVTESAGNGNDVTPSALGNQPWVISVASVNDDDVKASYSSFGEYVTVSAPGGDFSTSGHGILSTVPFPSPFFTEKYDELQGTSMASPVVASVIGLVKSYEPEISVIDLFERIVKSADNIDGLNPDYVGMLGSGRVNVYRAMTEEFTALPRFAIRSSRIIEPTLNSKAGIIYGNGQLDPGEEVLYEITLRNVWQDAKNVTIALSTENDWPIQIISDPVVIGDVGGIQDTNTWEAIAKFTVTCSEDAFPQSVELSINVTADGFEQQLKHHISIAPRVLMISDFDAINNDVLDFTSFYANALTENGIAFDQVYHSQTTIDADLLNAYNIVIWGCEWSFTSLEGADRDALMTYLDNGGALFISGQDVGWDLADETSTGNEFFNSGGASLAFYNDYIKSGFLADDANTNFIEGIDDDPITDDLFIDFFQSRRSPTSQYPDAISPLDGAISILKYETGSSGAISYNGDYRLVNFAFGGFEAVTEETVRNILMGRIVDFLDGVDVVHKPVKDREETTGTYDVKLDIILDTGEVDSVIMYWDNDGEFPYNVVGMSSADGSFFSAEIPSQETGSTVNYLIYIQTTDGKYSVTQNYEFHVGPDSKKPEIELLNEPYWNTVNAFGAYPYLFNVNLEDNLGIDTSSAKIHYWIGNAMPESNDLFHLQGNEYAGSFEFEEALNFGTEVKFYFSVMDASVAQNETLSDTFSYFVDSVQILDDFEDEPLRWDLGNGWDVTSSQFKNGDYSITDSPFGDYQNNENNPLTFKVPFDLSNYKFAEFSFWIKSTLELNRDSLILEASNDGASWTLLAEKAKTGFAWRSIDADMTGFTGEGNEEVWIRFRLQSDTANTLDGVFIDDPMIRVSENPVTSINSEIRKLPLSFELKQNYPNPFNPSTTIEYHIAEQSKVTLTIYNMLGQQVEELISNSSHSPGKYRLDWLAENSGGLSLASGIYIYQLKAVTGTGNVKLFTKKLILLK